MKVSTNPYQTNTTLKSSAQEGVRTNNATSTTSTNTGSSTSSTVSISSSAQALYTQSSAVERQSAMSQSELKALHDSTWSGISDFSRLIASKNYDKESLLPNTDDPARMQLGEAALEFSIAHHHSPGKVSNPFSGMARSDLSAITYDESGTYTDAERYAASVELRRQDYEYFSALFAKTTNGGDNREVYKGILDYFDELSPVEKTAYPDDFKETYEGFYQEQVDQWGPLALLKQSTEDSAEEQSGSIVKEGQSTQEMLQAILDKAIGVSKAQ